MPLFPDSHWLRAVVSLAEQHTVLVHRDIRAADGRRLVARGEPLRVKHFPRLNEHKLEVPLELCLRVEGAVTMSQIRRRAGELADGEPFIANVLAWVSRELAPLELLAEIPVRPPLALKLTVARELRPGLFNHSVLVALICLYLAVRAGWTRPFVLRAVTAGLLHDLGELHLDPAVLDSGKRLSHTERARLHLHPTPVTELLGHLPEYHPSIARAVAEHHERLDGSGYPARLDAHRLSPPGRLLAVAEVMGSRFDAAGQCRECRELATIFKLNTHKLAPEFIHLLAPLFRQEREAVEPGVDRAPVAAKLEAVAALLAEWEQATAAHAGLEADPQGEALFDYVTAQVLELRTQLFDAGFDPRRPTALLEAEVGSVEYLDEVEAIVNETLWQFAALANEVVQRWPAVLARESEAPLVRWVGRAVAPVPGG